MAPRRSVETRMFSSRVLRGNPLGDPHERELPVYLPPSYAREPGRRYPTLYLLAGFGGSGPMLLNRRLHEESLPERFDRLIRSGKMREMIVALPDCLTRYGGSQYMNSAGTGRYEDYLLREIVPFVDGNYRTIAASRSRAVAGKSSGGYGAFRLAARRPDVFGHMLCHSGDMLFEHGYTQDFLKCCVETARFGGVRGFLRRFDKIDKTEGRLHPALNTVAMASCYSPNPRAALGFDLPFEERSGLRVAKVWSRWLAQDPVRMARRLAGNLRRLKTLYFDCGRRDEFYLHFGARALSDALRGLRVAHRFEEYDGGHFKTAHRYDASLTHLSGRLR